MSANDIEFVVTYKTEPLTTQLETIRKTEQAANELAFQIEVNGGVAVVSRRIKPNPVNRNDMWLDN